MKNKEKYDIRHLIFNVSKYQKGIVKEINIFYQAKRIEKMKFLGGKRITPAMNAIGNWLEEEYKPNILDDVEKDYLSAVIKPFRKDIEYIEKFKSNYVGKEYIYIVMKKDDDYCKLPRFFKGTMYKGMEANREYTLEELGL